MIPAPVSRGLVSVAGIVVAAGALCTLIATAAPGEANSRIPLALVCIWSCCLAMVWCGAAALCWRWYLTRDNAAGWLAAAAMCGAVYLTSCALRLYVEVGVGRGVSIVQDIGVVMIGVWLSLTYRGLAGEDRVPWIGPVWLGVLLGLPGAALQLLVLTMADPDPTVIPVWADRSLVVALGIGGVFLLVRTRVIPDEVRRQLLVVCVFGTMSRALVAVDPVRPSISTLASAGCALIAAAVLGRLALMLLVRARSDADSEHAAMSSRGGNADEQLHEVRASFAAVASAMRLVVRPEVDLTHDRRADLTRMLTDEIDRLERLLSGRPAESVPDVDLDDVMQSLVTARRATGQRVEWTPTRCHVEGSRDMIATAVNMLLVNASVHAPGALVRVSAVADGTAVRVRVSDDGPGIPKQLRPDMFRGGVRRDDSPGRGIGLHFARRLVDLQGGSLRLADEGTTNATFEMTLPGTHVREIR